MTTVSAVYFDGRRAQPRDVTLTVVDRRAILTGDGVDLTVPIEALEIPAALGRTPRIVRFPAGGFCQVADHTEFDRWLADAGVIEGPLARWERNWRWVLVSVAVFVAVVALAYRYGVPAVATAVADRLPPSAVESMSRQVLAVMDRTVFEPSEIPPARQAALVERFAGLPLPGRAGGQRYDLIFRKAPRLGANAVALPSGTIVMTDALVALARDDGELVAVAAHEAGHVDLKHGLRLALQQSMVALLVTWYVGDVSTLAAAAPAALLNASYSRAFERDADAYAADVLVQIGIPLALLADILERLEASRGQSGGAELGYLSSHPATTERLERLRGR
jgi:Zn-dependent protease with chaperone function